MLLRVYAVLWMAAVLLPLGALAAGTARETAHPTPLDTYVYAEDAHYGWKFREKTEALGCTTYSLELTSQAWLTEAEVDRTVWTHDLLITVPAEVKSDIALLYITGGNNDGKPARRMGADFVRMAAASGAVVAQLNQVPNQPLTFVHTGKRAVEDGILAEGWRQFLETGDTKWLGRLPMTKSAVRAMDAITEFLGSEAGGGIRVSRFVPAGGSKRGWTAWMVAAVDARVTAVIPIVIDLLNLIPSFEHHFAVYGFWAPAIDDYTQRGIMDWMHTPEYRAMLDIVDPYSYRTRLTMPKMVINAADDQFFLPDSWRFYWNDLAGPKYLRYVPNAGHGLGGSDAANTINAFFHSIASGTPLPEYTWEMGEDGVLSVESRTRPLKVALWRATNPASRDFRLETVGNEAWTAEPIEAAAGKYAAKLEAPPSGYSAFLIELEYAGPGEATLKLTTPVYILPDKVEHTYPEPDPLPRGFITRGKD